MTGLNLSCFWKPGSVVVVGASPKGGLGYNILKNFQTTTVKVFAVHPTHEEILGVTAYPKLKDLPEIPDCVVFVTRADVTVELLKEAGEKGIKGAVIYASGFGESESGVGLERELQAVARQYGMVVCGPNCLGPVNFMDGISLLSSEAAIEMIKKNNQLLGNKKVSIISQSGGLLFSICNYARARGLKICRAVSSGNEAVTDLSDYLDDFIDDKESDAILILAESIRRPEKFIKVAERAMGLRKPIVWLPLGRTEEGAKVAATHTGAIARPARILDAVFEHFGIIAVESITELVETGILCTRYPEPLSCKGEPKIAILSITGGGAVHCTDWAERVSLKRAKFSPETLSVLREKGSAFSSSTNPLDTGWPVMNDKDRSRAILEALTSDKEVDILIVILPISISGDPTGRAEKLFATLGEYYSRGKPIVFISTAAHSFGEYWHPLINPSNIAFLEDIGTGFRVLSKWARGRAYQESIKGEDSITEEYKISGPSDRLWTEYEGELLLESAGVPIPMGKVVEGAAEVVRASEQIGYPVMLKVIYPPVEHKARMGFVAGPLRNSREVTEAYQHILEKSNLQDKKIQFLVHQYIQNIKAEIMVSITNKFEFGNFLILSVGGRFVLEEQAKVILLPCSENRIRDALHGILQKHFDLGLISKDDIERVVSVTKRVVGLGLSASNRLRTIEINPLVISEGNAYAVDAVVEPIGLK